MASITTISFKNSHTEAPPSPFTRAKPFALVRHTWTRLRRVFSVEDIIGLGVLLLAVVIGVIIALNWHFLFAWALRHVN
jgi:hypothetical protein